MAVPSESDWITFARVRHDGRWNYSATSPRLADDTNYQFRVAPYDQAGNKGTVLAFAAERIVRWPDATVYTVTYNAGPQTVTFDAS